MAHPESTDHDDQTEQQYFQLLENRRRQLRAWLVERKTRILQGGSTRRPPARRWFKPEVPHDPAES